MCAFFFRKITVFLFILRLKIWKCLVHRSNAKRYRDKKLALDPEGWREEQRLRVASTRAQNGPLTEEQRLDRNEVSRLGMQDLRARRDRQAKAAKRANVSTLMNN